MSWVQSFMICRVVRFTAMAAAVILGSGAAWSQTVVAEDASAIGRIDFDDADLPPANVEVDLSQGMFGDLFGIGDAAIDGVAKTLLESSERTGGADGTRLAAEQLAAARQIMQLASNVIQEVRVRAYEEMPEGVVSRFDGQLREDDWETIVRARKDNENVQVSLLRSDGAIRGVFIVAAGNDGLVLANLVGDVSPENARKLSSAAAKIGLDNGLQKVLEEKMREMHRHRPQRDGNRPEPPKPPKVEEVRR